MQARINRAMDQSIYLLKAESVNDIWHFVVQGETKSEYNVIFSDNVVNCSCPDCKWNKRTCKHIIFIIGRVAKDMSFLNGITSDLKSIKMDDKLNDKLTKNLRTRLHGKDEQTRLTTCEDDCIICFESIDSVIITEQQCTVCKIIYHKECIDRWLNQYQRGNTGNCAHCKQPWVKSNPDDDCLAKLC